MTAALLHSAERQEQSTEHQHATGASPADEKASLSAAVWAMAKGVVDKGIAAPIDNVLEMTGASSLYKMATGNQLPHLAGSAESLHTKGERMWYATGQSLGENIPLAVSMFAAPLALEWLGVRTMIGGAKLVGAGQSMMRSAAAYSEAGAMSSILGSTLHHGGSFLTTAGTLAARPHVPNSYLEYGLAGFGQGLLTADSHEQGWSGRLKSAAFSSGVLIAERKLGTAFAEGSPMQLRKMYGENRMFTVGYRPEMFTGAMTGIVVGASATLGESYFLHGHDASNEQIFGATLGRAITGGIIGAHAQGSLASLGWRYLNASNSNRTPLSMMYL